VSKSVEESGRDSVDSVVSCC